MKKAPKHRAGRGARHNPHNRFLHRHSVREHPEGLDVGPEEPGKTEVFIEHPKTIVNKVLSPDIGLDYSLNPYQGCEHGCVYCYARPTHEYWGWSSGTDFEQKIIVKKNAPRLLEDFFRKPNLEVTPIMLAGNTDIYQPLERKYRITRGLLEVFAKYRYPVGLITKNALVTRDLDVLQELDESGLVHVSISVTTLDEKVRQVMEPRTASVYKRLQTIETLSNAGIPVRVMVAPIIPGLTDHEIPAILRAVSDAGAIEASYIVVRLNGTIGEIFMNWVRQEFPHRADKILSQVAAVHGGKINDSRFGTRMKGEGTLAKIIGDLFRTAKRKYMHNQKMPPLNRKAFIRPHGEQFLLWG